MPHPESQAGAPRSPLVAGAYTLVLVLLMSLYSLAINNITFATNDYRSIVIQAVAIAAVPWADPRPWACSPPSSAVSAPES